MRLRSVLPSLALALCSAAPFAISQAQAMTKPAEAFVNGAGNLTCGRWTAVQPVEVHSPLRLVFTNWLAGYVSGYNAYRGGNLLSEAGWDAAVAWMDGYCVANPEDTVASAASRLAIGVSHRQVR